jgi:hypothetical protein
MSFVLLHFMYFMRSSISFRFSFVQIGELKAQNSSCDTPGLSNLNCVCFFLANSEFIIVIL